MTLEELADEARARAGEPYVLGITESVDVSDFVERVTHLIRDEEAE